MVFFPGGDKSLVCADPPGDLGDDLLRGLGVGRGVSGAEPGRHLPLAGQRVHRDDVPGARERRALDGVDADAADPVHHGGVARPHVARVDRSAPPGRHPAADQRHRLKRQVIVDLDAGMLGHHRTLGERAEQAHLAEVLAVAVEPERAVRQAVVEEQRAEVAQVGHAAGAEPAVPADRKERADHVVARLNPAHAGAGLLDGPRPLVPADDRVADRDVAGAHVVVGVAQAGGGEPDKHLAITRRIKVQFDDLPVLAYVPEYRCLGFHATSRSIRRHHPPERPRRSLGPAPRVRASSWPRKNNEMLVRQPEFVILPRRDARRGCRT